MSTTTITSHKLELRTGYGPVFRDILNIPPRDCTPEEIPVIDLTPLFSDDPEHRKQVASQLHAAATNTGFFYIKNHGISDEAIANAKKQLLAFFHQPTEKKEMIDVLKSKYFNGYRAFKTSQSNATEGFDVKESMAWRYAPQYDPVAKDMNAIPEEVKPWIRGEEFIWEGTAHLPGFKEDVLTYWASCVTLSRKLVQAFALSLGLPEEYFDSKVTYPGADGVFNYYPVNTKEELSDDNVALGSHTDLQLFTLLWQDMTRGLQVLSKEGQWIKAVPIEGTIVVNIGDFMMRLSNDVYKSTVHRVYNRSNVERVSMPFFFGLNFNCVEGVVPTCTSADNPPKYEPISCGDWCQLRFKNEREGADKALREKEMMARGPGNTPAST